MRTCGSWTLLALGVLSVACSGSDPARESGATGETAYGSGTDPGRRLSVAVVNYPLAWLAGVIGGDRVTVVFPAPTGEDPAYWSPGPDEIAVYQRADLILLNGAGYASWTDRASLPPSKLVDTSAGYSDLYLPAGESIVHAHGPEGEHEHGETAFTTWLDPRLLVSQAETVREALVRTDSSASGTFAAGLARVREALTQIDAELTSAFSPLAGTPLLGSHPVYQYLARRYDLDLRNVHFEPDEVPSAAGWDELRALLADRSSSLMLWEAEPLPEVRERLERELGIRSIVFEPCANRPAQGDFPQVMSANAARVAAAAAMR